MAQRPPFNRGRHRLQSCVALRQGDATGHRWKGFPSRPSACCFRDGWASAPFRCAWVVGFARQHGTHLSSKAIRARWTRSRLDPSTDAAGADSVLLYVVAGADAASGRHGCRGAHRGNRSGGGGGCPPCAVGRRRSGTTSCSAPWAGDGFSNRSKAAHLLPRCRLNRQPLFKRSFRSSTHTCVLPPTTRWPSWPHAQELGVSCPWFLLVPARLAICWVSVCGLFARLICSFLTYGRAPNGRRRAVNFCTRLHRGTCRRWSKVPPCLRLNVSPST